MTRRKAGQGQLFDPPKGAPVARVRRYVDRQLKAQRQLGQLEPVDDGLVGIVMTLADVVDEELRAPERSAFVVITGLAKLSPMLLELRGERHTGGGAGIDLELESLTAAFRDAMRPGPSE